jgi:hypothetical protein
MNDYVMAIACMKDTDHAENTACIYNPDNGMDGFDVSLVLCSDPFKLSQKLGFVSYCTDFRIVGSSTVPIAAVGPDPQCVRHFDILYIH